MLVVRIPWWLCVITACVVACLVVGLILLLLYTDGLRREAIVLRVAIKKQKAYIREREQNKQYPREKINRMPTEAEETRSFVLRKVPDTVERPSNLASRLRIPGRW